MRPHELALSLAIGLMLPLHGCASVQPAPTPTEEVALPAKQPGCPDESGTTKRGCEAHIRCETPEATPPPLHYPAPYDRCDASKQTSGFNFAPDTTRERREAGADVCCYVSLQLDGAAAP